MGLNASLSVITRSGFRNYPQVNPTPLAQFDLHKSWTPLELALRTMHPPLNLALQGNRPNGAAFDDDWDAYDAFVTPALAKRIYDALEKVSDNDLIAALKSVGFAQHQREHAEHLAFFSILKAAYREAVKQDAYLRIFIS